MDGINFAALGTHIRDARVRAGFTQGELAARIGAAPESIESIEGGFLPVDPFVVEKLLTALGLRDGHNWDVDVEVAVAAVGELLQAMAQSRRTRAIQEVIQILRASRDAS